MRETYMSTRDKTPKGAVGANGNLLIGIHGEVVPRYDQQSQAVQMAEERHVDIRGQAAVSPRSLKAFVTERVPDPRHNLFDLFVRMAAPTSYVFVFISIY